MKQVFNGKQARSFLRWVQLAFFAAAAIALVYCAFVLADARLYQRRERQELSRLQRQSGDSKRPDAKRQAKTPAITDGEILGRIDIRRLGISTVVAEGTDERTLRRAAGHIQGTALPGQSGNVGIAGHRDTFFRPLRNIRMNDVIVLATANGEYRYRVTSTRVVLPTDVYVLAPGAGQTLTLVTCYPFYFVGSAPDRFIVRAERITG